MNTGTTVCRIHVAFFFFLRNKESTFLCCHEPAMFFFFFVHLCYRLRYAINFRHILWTPAKQHTGNDSLHALRAQCNAFISYQCNHFVGFETSHGGGVGGVGEAGDSCQMHWRAHAWHSRGLTNKSLKTRIEWIEFRAYLKEFPTTSLGFLMRSGVWGTIYLLFICTIKMFLLKTVNLVQGHLPSLFPFSCTSVMKASERDKRVVLLGCCFLCLNII